MKREPAAEVQAWLDPRAGEMAELLGELVSLDTENPPGRSLCACGRALQRAMAKLGFDAQLMEVPPAAQLEDPCVVRAAGGEGSRTIYFHGHFDVVPASRATSSNRAGRTAESLVAVPPT